MDDGEGTGMSRSDGLIFPFDDALRAVTKASRHFPSGSPTVELISRFGLTGDRLSCASVVSRRRGEVAVAVAVAVAMVVAVVVVVVVVDLPNAVAVAVVLQQMRRVAVVGSHIVAVAALADLPIVVAALAVADLPIVAAVVRAVADLPIVVVAVDMSGLPATGRRRVFSVDMDTTYLVNSLFLTCKEKFFLDRE